MKIIIIYFNSFLKKFQMKLFGMLNGKMISIRGLFKKTKHICVIIGAILTRRREKRRYYVSRKNRMRN